ncbi:hypothetical protein ACFOPQ_07660 [Deinococcus antarcticus]|uniref:Histone H1 n=2 Tax=Deinococcus TaxID=1298 RepID=A0AAU6Q5R3_9DEIO
MKKFDFNEILDSGQLQAGMNKAVKEAIMKAEAAGLPRAYRPSPPCEPDQEQSTPVTTRRSA